jgi:hypothetical protein
MPVNNKKPFLLRHRWLPVAFGATVTAFDIWWFLDNSFSWLRLINIFTFFLGITVSWYYSHRNAFGWIYFNLGTPVDVSISGRVVDLTDEESDEAITDWLNLSGIKHFTKTNTFRYYFLRKKDAVQFKLAWG